MTGMGKTLLMMGMRGDSILCVYDLLFVALAFSVLVGVMNNGLGWHIWA